MFKPPPISGRAAELATALSAGEDGLDTVHDPTGTQAKILAAHMSSWREYMRDAELELLSIVSKLHQTRLSSVAETTA
jgi:hypothetical protein